MVTLYVNPLCISPLQSVDIYCYSPDPRSTMDDSPQEKQPPSVLASDTENATRIPVEEAPPHKQHKFKKFRAYNTGLWNGPRRENKEAMHRQDDLHLWDAIAGQLELTDRQKERGRRVFDNLDLGQFNKRNGTSDTAHRVAFALAVLVANDDVPDGTRYWPTGGKNSSLFAEIANDLGLNWKEQMSLIKRVQDRVDL